MEKVGPFILIGRLATGGMAEVFLARRDGPAGFEKIQVVKRILPQFAEDPEFRRMFLDEARLAALINHPNVVQIFELGGTRDALYIAMEYVPGFDLARVMDASLKARRLLPAPVSARIVADAAAGLDFAHRLTDPKGQPRGIVHRDISPENLLVAELGTVKVVDFGIARASTGQNQLSNTGRLKGKVHYHAPEHISGKPLDGKADVYALGVVLYELACARRPFEGLGELEVMRKTVEVDPPHPSTWYAAADPELSEISLRALARDPAARPSAGELRNELELYLRKNPCTAADIERYLLEVIPADAPDRTKPRKLLEEAPERQPSQSDPGRIPAVAVMPAQPPPPEEHTVRDRRRRVALPIAIAGGATALLGGIWLATRPAAPAPAVDPPQTAVITMPAPPPSNEVAVTPPPPHPVPASDRERETHLSHASGHRPSGMERAGSNASYVVVHVSPSCTLRIDDDSTERKIGRELSISPGRHVLHFTNPALRLDAYRTVVLKPGANPELHFTFEKKAIAVQIFPWASVTVDGESYGMTPMLNRKLELFEGAHKVELKYEQKTQPVELKVSEAGNNVLRYSFKK